MHSGLSASPSLASSGTAHVAPAPAVLLYDGDCGFCAGSVQFVLRHESAERRAALHFAPLQGALGTTVRAAHGLGPDLRSVLWVEPSPTGEAPRIRQRSDAALAALRHLGGGWALLAALGALVPRALRDALYDQVARRRFDLAAPACLLPTPDQRARFLP